MGKRKLRAVAVHTFAGGMLMGVRRAGFQVDQAYEPLDYGTGTLRRRHGVRVMACGMEDASKWPLPDGDIDFVFGNPRCGGFSHASNSAILAGGGKRKSRNDGLGANCYQSVDTEQLVRFGTEIVKAPVVAWESVQALPNSASNRPFLERMIDEYLLPNGYQVAHVFHSAANFGSAQNRRRYFCVGYQRGLEFNLDVPTPPEKMVTISDVLEPLLDRPAVASNELRRSRGGEEYHGDMYLAHDRVEHV